MTAAPFIIGCYRRLSRSLRDQAPDLAEMLDASDSLALGGGADEVGVGFFTENLLEHAWFHLPLEECMAARRYIDMAFPVEHACREDAFYDLAFTLSKPFSEAFFGELAGSMKDMASVFGDNVKMALDDLDAYEEELIERSATGVVDPVASEMRLLEIIDCLKNALSTHFSESCLRSYAEIRVEELRMAS